MNKQSLVYKFLKKVENPSKHGLFYFFNLIMCWGLSIYGYFVKRSINRIYPGKTILILPSRSAGDVLLLYYLFPVLIRKSEIIDYVLLVDFGGCSRAAKAVGFDSVLPIKLIKLKALLLYQRAHVIEKTDIYDCYPWCMIDLACINNKTLLSSIKIKSLSTIEFSFNNVGQKGVILSPYENSISALGFQTLPYSFWTKLSEELKRRGYDVYTNCKGTEEEPLINGTQRVYPLFSEIIPLVESVGSFIAVRSGFVDFAMHASANKVILYPSNEFKNYFSIRRTRTADDCTEIVYGVCKDFSDLISQIIMSLNKRI